MAAITAAVVVAGAAAATAGMQAAQAHKAGKAMKAAGGGYVGPGLQERLFNRGTRDIMDAERAILDDALSQGKLLEPEVYRALGLEPVYDRDEDPDIAPLSRDLAAKQERLATLQREQSALKLQRPRGARGARDQARALRGQKRERSMLQRDIASLQSELEQRGSVGRRVVGFKPLGGIADPTGSAGGAFGGALDEFNTHLASALAGKEPIDPTLKTAFEEKERALRSQLQRQLGPDYANSTAGSQALSNFDRERAEAFASYNTNAIKTFSSLSENRAAALNDLTAGRMKNLAFPASFRAGLARELESAAAGRREWAGRGANERERKGAGRRRAALDQVGADQAKTDALVGLINAGAGAVSAGAGAYGSGATTAGALATPETVQVPEYVNGGGMSTPSGGLGSTLGR